VKEAHFPDKPTCISRYSRAGRVGSVRVYYGRTDRASKSGFPALKGWARETRAGVGFPTIKCQVESGRPGYWSVLGWIQWVTQSFPGKKAGVRLIDRLPSFLDLDMPFAAVGYAPTFFDAPAYNSLPAVDWHATLFLCTLPLLNRREATVPLAGFRWGYHIEHRGELPIAYPLERAVPRDWKSVREELMRRHPSWNFARELKNGLP
jgi:hypothetical protein